MMTCTIKFPTESSAKEAGKWLRFFTGGFVSAPDRNTLMFTCRRFLVMDLVLDNIRRHIPPVDWERTEITVNGEEE